MLKQLTVIGLVLLAACTAAPAERWYRGNTHTHTLWSDGDAPPEVSVAWYRDRGYDFLALSDHNVLSQGERWVAVRADQRMTPAKLESMKKEFPGGWAVLRGEGSTLQMRLKTLPELKEHFERPDEFILIQAEEITSKFQNHPVHVNGVNLEKLIPPQRGVSVADVMQKSVDAVREQSRRTGTPMLAHLNHPNFGWGVVAEDLIQLKGDRFFEVYNGHPAVRNWGDDAHPGTDRMWDIINAVRLTQRKPILFGVATDDTHHYYAQRVGLSNSGRGWIMVRAESLTADAIVRAMQRGDFYSTTGITLRNVEVTPKFLKVEIEEEEGVAYRVQFIGTLRGFDATSKPILDNAGAPAHITRSYSKQIGRTLFDTNVNPATYWFSGKELYVRAKITSTKKHPNPHSAGDVEMAWTQPVVGR